MKSNLKVITKANIVRRLVSLIADAIMTVFIMGFLSTLVFTPIANKAFNYIEKSDQMTRYKVASNLFAYIETDTDGNKKIYELNELNQVGDGSVSIVSLYFVDIDELDIDIDYLKERIRYYYQNYKTGEGIIVPEGNNENDFKAPNSSELIDGISPKEYYSDAWFDENVGSETDIDKLVENQLVNALNDLYNQEYMVSLSEEITRIENFITVPAFVVSFGIFFILIPCLFKNGETLGKKFFHVGFVDYDGYSIKKRQILIRQIILLAYVSLCSFILGVSIISIVTVCLGVLIYFIPTFISKTKRSPVDHFTHVLLIDTQSSVWFKDPEEEKQKELELEENMSHYDNKEILDSSVIQVGSTIVNDDIKKEIEEQNKEK